MFRVEVNEEKVISELGLTQEEIKDFEEFYIKQGDAYLCEVIQQSTTDGYTSESDEFSTTETEIEDSELSGSSGKEEK